MWLLVAKLILLICVRTYFRGHKSYKAHLHDLGDAYHSVQYEMNPKDVSKTCSGNGILNMSNLFGLRDVGQRW